MIQRKVFALLLAVLVLPFVQPLVHAANEETITPAYTPQSVQNLTEPGIRNTEAGWIPAMGVSVSNILMK